MADWRSNDYYQKLRVGKVDPKDLEFFKSEPSTRKWLEHAQYSPIITAARLTITDREDVFLNTTLKTDDTISHWSKLEKAIWAREPRSIDLLPSQIEKNCTLRGST